MKIFNQLNGMVCCIWVEMPFRWRMRVQSLVPFKVVKKFVLPLFQIIRSERDNLIWCLCVWLLKIIQWILSSPSNLPDSTSTLFVQIILVALRQRCNPLKINLILLHSLFITKVWFYQWRLRYTLKINYHMKRDTSRGRLVNDKFEGIVTYLPWKGLFLV